jgi:ABC-type phosphate/phosphonate transport system substrate-binding protein
MSHGPRPSGLRPVIALIAIAALVFAGCGGSSSSPNAKASTNAKPRMIAQADAICKGMNEHRKAANKEVGAVTSVASLRVVAEVAPFLQAFEHGEITELRKLTPPSDVAAVWQKILAGTERLAANTGEELEGG